VNGTDVAKLVTLYEEGSPPSDLASRFGVSQERIRRVLRKNGVQVRPQGRPKGWRKLTEREIARRIAAGIVSTTWEDYRAKARLRKTYNVRLDRRYGVRLACFNGDGNISVGTGRVKGYVRQLCEECLRREKR
jgi:hypothetical protein